MQGLAPSQLLDVWEQGVESGGIERGLLLLARCLPDTDWQELAALSIGRRNRLLLELRSATFGEAMHCFALCPGCAGELEFDFKPSELGFTYARKDETVLQVDQDGRTIRGRLPDSTDLYAASSCHDVEEARRTIAARCLAAENPAALPLAAIEDFEARIAEADAGSDISLDLTCPTCGHSWELALDVVGFFWQEIHSAARRIALEVDALARSYGWSEAAILGMSTARRNLYLEMVG